MDRKTISKLGTFVLLVVGLSVAVADYCHRAGLFNPSFLEHPTKEHPRKEHPRKERASKDIVDTAVDASDFNTLVAAVTAADLVETLKGEGPFTLFAPTDQAFSNLPEGTLEDLLAPENKDKLISVLTYHVVPGKVMAAEVVELTEAETVNGQTLSIQVQNGKVMVDAATVIKTDIECRNGVIHVIDAVLLPD